MSFLKKKTDPDSADNRKDTMTNKIESPVHLVYELCIKVIGYSTNGLVVCQSGPSSQSQKMKSNISKLIMLDIDSRPTE